MAGEGYAEGTFEGRIEDCIKREHVPRASTRVGRSWLRTWIRTG